MSEAMKRTQLAAAQDDPNHNPRICCCAAVVKKHGGVRATEAALGIDKSFISRLMNGKKVNPSAETLAKLGLRAVPRYERIGGAG